MSEWISVQDRLPEIPRNHLHAERPVLVSASGKVYAAHLCAGLPTGHRSWDVSEDNRGLRFWFIAESKDSYQQLESVTHWMPLPEPPK